MRAAFQFGLASWPAHADVVIMTQQNAIKPRTQDSQRKSLHLDSGHF